MRIARIVDGDGREVLAVVQADGLMLRVEGDMFGGGVTVSGEVVEAVRFLPPVEPRAIICIGLNYRKHAEEFDSDIPKMPVVFMKNPAAATGHNQPIRIPAVCGDEVDYECELAVVIAAACCDVSKEDALEFVLGYMAGNDVSARIWQKDRCGGQWCKGKSFDTFAPMGPVLVTADEIDDPGCLEIKSELNGQVVQRSNTADMIFGVAELVSFLSRGCTLLPGTVIMTGTPGGVGWMREPRVLLQDGDTIAVEIEGIGRLVNAVVRE